MSESVESFDLEALNAAFCGFVPHNQALGLVIEGVTAEPPSITMRLEWREDLVGNPETGALHGGVVTTLLDSVSGAAVYVKLKAPVPIATLDLRVDVLKPATPRRPLRAKATCVKATHNVAFVRAVAFHDDEADPVATGTSTFMLSTKGRSVTEQELHGGRAVTP